MNEPIVSTLFVDDETAWLEQTSTLVAQGRFSEIDAASLSEYLSDMARRDKREVASRLTVLFIHLLKWDRQPNLRTKSWEATISHQRLELGDLLESGALANHAREILPKAYLRARKHAALEMGISEAEMPEFCPWSIDDAIAVD